MENIEVTHKENKHRFLAQVNGYEARLKYKLREEVMEIYKVEVPHELRGQGVGNKLLEIVLNYAKEHNYKIKPTCSFSQKIMEKNPDYKMMIVEEK
jgi:predicted GNAT family acetyltransferase